MFVAMVTLPGWPASAMICASCSWCLAFRTLWGTPWRVSSPESRSDFSIETVPTRTGRPCVCSSLTSSRTAWNFSFSVR